MSQADQLRELKRALVWVEDLKQSLEPADQADVDKQVKRLRKLMAKHLTKYIDSLEAQKLGGLTGSPGNGLPTA